MTIDTLFAGRTVVVTGAGAGIGLALTRAFSAAGATVYAGELAEERLAGLNAIPNVHGLRIDVSDRDDAERLIDAATASGRIDVLVNNAGIPDRLEGAEEVRDEQWERLMTVNLTGPMMTTRRALPAMLSRGAGVIVNVASIAGFAGARSGAAYTSSKHGLIGLTRSTAAQYGSDGIRCVAVCPGAFETAMRDAMAASGPLSERGFATYGKVAPARPETLQPEALADLVLLVASDYGRVLNGSVITADGGWTVH